MRRVVATGTFDLLHPGHLYYLEESRRLGDELVVIVARDRNVRHKPKPVVPEDQRLKLVAALKPVDLAVLGDLHDMYRPIEELRPAVITFGFDQHFDRETIGRSLRERGLEAELVRIGAYEGDRFCSSSRIIAEVLDRHCKKP
jgi:FAD synthetase